MLSGLLSMCYPEPQNEAEEAGAESTLSGVREAELAAPDRECENWFPGLRSRNQYRVFATLGPSGRGERNVRDLPDYR